MLCPQCGSQRPDTDNFCAICGSTLHDVVGYSKTAPDLEWEYTDLTIPLNGCAAKFCAPLVIVNFLLVKLICRGVPVTGYAKLCRAPPLNVQATGEGVTEAMLHAAPQCDDLILRALQQASQEGWQPEGLCDFLSLEKAQRIIWRHDKPFSGAMRITCEAASVRLQRLVPGSVLDKLARVVDQVNH
jgi:hypothetical protein